MRLDREQVKDPLPPDAFATCTNGVCALTLSNACE
jgi:hypothetical protein